MSALAMRSCKGLFTGALAACLSVALVGCGQSEEKVADKGGASKTAAKPADNTKTPVAQPIQRVQKKPAGAKPAARSVTAQQPARKAPIQISAVKKTPPPVTKKTPPPVVKKTQQPVAAPKSSSQEDLRRETTDAIYAAIRVRMEQAILKRKELLDGGRDPSDVEIRSLEGQIMKARGFLIEAGEEVEDVSPPLLTKPKA